MTKAAHIELFANRSSPFARHCRVALLEEAITYQLTHTTPAESSNHSAMQKIPFLRYQDAAGNTQQLSDSSAIVMFVRALAGKVPFANAAEFDLYCQANTIADTAINLFVMAKTGQTPDNNPYLARQQSRLLSGLDALNALVMPTLEEGIAINDAWLRVACVVDWLSFRALVNTASYPNLQQYLVAMGQHTAFAGTDPHD